MKKWKIVYIAFLVCSIGKVSAQGCSDAGFCTMQHLGIGATDEQDTSLLKNDLGLGIATGVGDDLNSITNPYLTYSRDLNRKLSLSAKLIASFITGDKGTVAGLGDFFLSSSYKLLDKKKMEARVLAGFKLPFNNSNLKYQGNPLPLSYQSSLASIDAIIGVNVTIPHFDFNAGAQIPLRQNNKNTFIASGTDTLDFASTNQFLRKSDLLLRATYHFFNKRKAWKYSGGLLGIYHLGTDTYENVLGQRQEIAHSEGLTLNAVLALHHYLPNNRYFTLSLAAPFVVREIRPDGLTRGFVASFEYHFKF